jgi:iron complex outermembrane receptor protein
MNIRFTVFSCVLAIVMLFFMQNSSSAQNYSITGTVTSATTGEKLPGANVILMGTNYGAATTTNGEYKISAPEGTYSIKCSYVGFAPQTININLTNNTEVNFALQEEAMTLSVTVLADRAKERETPVAFTDIPKSQMQQQLGSQDIPMVLNNTPSVYATEQGGGAGDARINVRGFDQTNIAIMINGLPANDLESGWLYWSDWSGLGDATANVQIQRGLSATTLAVPSIGGTINIITDPAEQNFGIQYRQEYGSGTYWKYELLANSGLIDNKFAFNVQAVRSLGDGVVDKTWTNAWNFYLGASYNINDNNRLSLYLMSAPQRHGENPYAQNIAAFSHDYAASLSDYHQAAFVDFPQSPAGRLYNENWNVVSPSYTGLQYWDGSTHNRYDPNFINQSENYFNKPIVQLNWYSQLTDKLNLYTTGFWEGGNGGGSSTFGSLVWDYSGPSRIPDWNATIARNEANATGSRGILYNQVNDQWTWGGIAKAYYKVTDNFTASLGGRYTKNSTDHFGEVRDLLGGPYFIDSNDYFDSNTHKVLGDKMYYFETSGINRLGLYGQGEYTKDKVTAYANYAWSEVKYSDQDHFHPNADSTAPLNLESSWIQGYQLKGGASYRVSNSIDVFANVGYVSQVPIRTSVIDEINRVLNPNPTNQKYTDYEAGINFRTDDRRATAKIDYYYTKWKDHTNTVNIVDQSGNYSVVLLTGINSLSTGFEFEGAWKPIDLIRINASASIGNWKYTSDVSGQYINYNGPTPTAVSYNYYINGLKFGNAPQTQTALTLSVMPIDKMIIQGVWRYYTNYYSDFNPQDRTNAADRSQVWKVPSYSLFDLHFNYVLPVEVSGVGLQVFAHVFNVFDKLYISDATDDSQYNAYASPTYPYAPINPHSADAAEVFMGLPRTFNVGVRLTY